MPVNVIGTLKPKNNGKFPVAEAVDIKVTDDLRLDEALENKADLSSVNFALAGKANVSDVTTSTANLQGQIDQIVISASAEAVVAPEVAAARVGSDGAEYTTLKERLDAENIGVTNTISALENVDNRNVNFTAYSGGIASCAKDSEYSTIIYSSANNRIRSAPQNANFTDLILIPSHTKISISVKSGYEYAFQCYSSDEQVAMLDFAFLSTDTDFELSVDTRLVLMIRRSNDKAITTAEATNISIKIYNPIADKIDNKIDFTVPQTLSTEQKAIAKANIGVTEDIGAIENTLDSLVVNSVDVDSFHWGVVNPDGSVVERDTDLFTLHNIFSDILSCSGAILTPINTDVIFKVVYYTADGVYLESTSWMGLEGTPYTIVDNYTINKNYCRICIASSAAEISISSISEQFNKLTYANVITFNSALLPTGEVEIPFDDYRINTTIKKVNNLYVADINPRSFMNKIENGVTVFMSPDGHDSNSGLTILSPKKTLESALSVTNVETIICLEGTYTNGVHYSSQQITQPINLIANGNVIFDNVTNNPLYFYRNVYVEGIHFTRGNGTVICVLAENDRNAVFFKCIFSESITNNGLAVLGGNAYVIDCIAHTNAFDGFNYHAKDNVVNHAIEINCKSYGNGTYHLDESDGQSSNATTSHDNSYIVRVNGDYKCCHGGVVADKECKSANYGCSSGISTVTDSNYPDRMSNYWSSAAEMYLYDCDSYGSKYDTAVINNGKITSNVTYPSNYPT